MASLPAERYRIEGTAPPAVNVRPASAVESILAEAFEAMERNCPDEAARLLEESLKLSPEHADTLLVLGYLRQTGGDKAAAAALYQRAAHADPSAWQPLYNQALLLEAEGAVAEALQVLKHCCAVAPREAVALFRLGWLFEMSSCDTEARYWYRRATEADDGQPHVWMRLGLLEVRSGHFTEAIPCLEQALRDEELAGSAYYHLGLCHLKTESPEQALAAFESAVKFDPQSADAMLALAGLALENGDLDTAEKQERCYRALGRVSAPLSLRLAQAWQDQGETELARLHYRRAVLAEPALALGYFTVQSQS